MILSSLFRNSQEQGKERLVRKSANKFKDIGFLGDATPNNELHSVF